MNVDLKASLEAKQIFLWLEKLIIIHFLSRLMRKKLILKMTGSKLHKLFKKKFWIEVLPQTYSHRNGLRAFHNLTLIKIKLWPVKIVEEAQRKLWIMWQHNKPIIVEKNMDSVAIIVVHKVAQNNVTFQECRTASSARILSHAQTAI